MSKPGMSLSDVEGRWCAFWSVSLQSSAVSWQRRGRGAVSQGGASEKGCSSLAAHLSSSSVNLHEKKICFFKYYEYILVLEYISDVAYAYQK